MPTPAAAGDADPLPRLLRRGLTDQLRELGYRLAAGAPERYQVQRLLGVGASGRVYSVTDTSLDRAVAMKVLVDSDARSSEGAEHLIEEARITASLSHPNVLPIYELDLNDDGHLYFTMKRIDGRTLGALIEQAGVQDRRGPVAPLNDLVRIFIGIAQAIAYAHHRGIVHQDIKPDNIMLGDFGEVLVVDWGSALRITPDAAPRIYGTPLYMSPEQARREHVDQRSDIYCLGTSLFHALCGRLPLWSDDSAMFWEKKRAGLLDLPTVAERRLVPPGLLAIALKAMSAHADNRYPSAEELLQDLSNFQAGLAVSAHAESWPVRARRWHRRHGRRLWLAAAVTSVILTLALALYGERLKELATWGRALPLAGFADDGWKRDWTVYDGSFVRDGDRLVSTGKDESELLCQRRFSGAIAVEYDGEILPDAKPCDISLMWCQDFAPSADPAKLGGMIGWYRLQIGAMDGCTSQIENGQGIVAFSYMAPTPGRVYHVRDEISDDRITIAVDGEVICDYHNPLPLSGGYISLRAFYPGKAFSHVRVYERALPEKLAATALGDLFVEREDYAEAAKQYHRVSEAHPGTRIAREAIYREGLCAFWQRRYDAAFVLWQPLAGSEYADRLRQHELDRLFEARQHDELLLALEQVYRSAPAEVKHHVATQWCRYMTMLDHSISSPLAPAEAAVLARYLALRDHLFPDEAITDRNAAQALLALGRYRELLERFPRLSYERGDALFRLGRSDLLLHENPGQQAWRDPVLINTGHADRVSPDSGLYTLALLKRGLAEEVLRRAPDDHYARAMALMQLGRLDEARLQAPDEWTLARLQALAGRASEVVTTDRRLELEMLMAQGQGERALALAPPGDPHRRWIRYLLGLQAWMRDDHAAAEQLFVHEALPDSYDCWEYHLFLVPFLHGLVGKRAELDAGCRDAIVNYRELAEQHDFYCARCLLGEIGEAEFLAQPQPAYMEDDLRRCQGMRAERAGDIPGALAAYRAYLALPLWKRGESVDAIWDTFVGWRVAQLEAASSPPNLPPSSASP